MHVVTLSPPAALSAAVSALWDERRPGHAHRSERIVPDGSVLVGINLGASPIVLRKGRESFLLHGAFACGPQVEPWQIEVDRPHHLLAALIKPGGARLLLGLPLSELRGTVVGLTELWRDVAIRLSDRVAKSESPPQRLAILAESFARRIATSPDRDPVACIAAKWFDHEIAISTREVRDRLGFSATRFLRLFEREIGVAPKQYARMRRFQRTLRTIAADTFGSWANLAVAHGYYDQAHLIHETQTFSGFTPTELRQRTTGCENHLVDRR